MKNLNLFLVVILAGLLLWSIFGNFSKQIPCESIVIHDTIFVNKLDVEMGIAIYMNGYMSGALHVINKGTWIEEKWQVDSIAAYKYFK